MKTYDDSNESGWVIDSGTSHQITGDPARARDTQPYLGTDGVIIGNGSLKNILHAS